MKNITRLFDFPYYQLEKYNLEESLVTKSKGNWVATSTKEYLNKANAISRGLIRLGVQANDKVAIISMNNRTEWNICDIGILQTGAQDVPIYPTISQEDYEYVLNHSEASYCFVSCKEVLDKVNAIKHNVPSLKEVFCFDEIDSCKNWSEVLELGKDIVIKLKLKKERIMYLKMI
jgi:long-chain acyl-CoA synthetase